MRPTLNLRENAACRLERPEMCVRRRAFIAAASFTMLAAPVTGFARDGCCGDIAPAASRLVRFLDNSGVDRLWLPGYQIDWRTGDRISEVPGGPDARTHCSAFAAAMAMRLGIYLLRPPEHKQGLLANAQMAWLEGSGGRANGWRALTTVVDAQSAANRGELVLASFRNPDPHKPGHIAIVRPGDMTQSRLERAGPMITQAGEHNAIDVPLARGFRDHPGAWIEDGEGSVRFFAHDIDWGKVKESS